MMVVVTSKMSANVRLQEPGNDTPQRQGLNKPKIYFQNLMHHGSSRVWTPDYIPKVRAAASSKGENLKGTVPSNLIVILGEEVGEFP